jgi:hypothetical protein
VGEHLEYTDQEDRREGGRHEGLQEGEAAAHGARGALLAWFTSHRSSLPPSYRTDSDNIASHGGFLVVLDKIRKGQQSEPQVVTQLRTHQWSNEAQRRDLVKRFLALTGLEVSDLVWTATEQNAEIRAAGLAMLKKEDRGETLEALVPLLRTRSEAIRRAVQRFVKEVAGDGLTDFLADLAVHGDDFARLSVLDLAREIPAEKAFAIFKKILADPHPVLRARALRAVSERRRRAPRRWRPASHFRCSRTRTRRSAWRRSRSSGGTRARP